MTANIGYWMRLWSLKGIVAIGILLINFWNSNAAISATVREHYYAHKTVEDKYGVIAPWYKSQNGQCDYRLRIAIETLKRYPWVNKDCAVMAAPHWVYSSRWEIDEKGDISIPKADNWMCGDLSQRMDNIINGMIHYYCYTGDPAAIAFIKIYTDYVLDYALTPSDHPWPLFPISVPTNGVPYGQCHPDGLIQLNLSAVMGTAVLNAYKLLGDDRYLATAMHWADVFAEKCNLDPDFPPWNRYADAESIFRQSLGNGKYRKGWSDLSTCGTILIVDFLDEAILLGNQGKNDSIVKARDAGLAYIQNIILPNWTDEDAWGHHYWDVEQSFYGLNAVVCCSYFMEHPEIFSNWKTDVRNILSLCFNKFSANPLSEGDVYHGAWSLPESYRCCKTSHSYVQYGLASAFAQYGTLAKDEWACEIARRMYLMSTYDSLGTGVVTDGILGDVIVAKTWLNCAHPRPLRKTLEAMAWMPEIFGPNRENHILSSSDVVNSVTYEKGKIVYATFDAPEKTVEVLRLSFSPIAITANGKKLDCHNNIEQNGYTVNQLPNGDCIVEIRHDGFKHIIVEGEDPQSVVDDTQMQYSGNWSVIENEKAFNGSMQAASENDAAMSYTFVGNQIRLIGSVRPDGGLADIYIDGKKQLVFLDCWNPYSFDQKVLYYRNGLSNDRHELTIVARGKNNPLSSGRNVYLDAIQYSEAVGNIGFGEGGGPKNTQRMIFGYAGKKDYIDSSGKSWRPGTEFVIRSGKMQDTVANSWWTKRRTMSVRGTNDPELYRYGVHGKEFWINVTVGPGQYYVLLKFASTPKEGMPKKQFIVTVLINGEEVITGMDVAAEAGGRFKALDKIFKNISPRNGVIEIRFKGCNDTEAIIQAMEVGHMKDQ